MRALLALLVLSGLGLAITGAPNAMLPLRIMGGNLTTIDHYPFMVALLFTDDYGTNRQGCAGTIINNRSILTAAHCCLSHSDPTAIRVRVGSTNASSGGVVHEIEKCTLYNRQHIPDMDFAVIRLASPITFNDKAKPGVLADPNYYPGDNETVWAAGWGWINNAVTPSEQLRHVQLRTVNQAVCKKRYGGASLVNADMLCAGWLDVGGRGSCKGDSGGPLVHNGVVVGVTSWFRKCGDPYYPNVYARVSRAYDWIQANA